MKTVVYSSPFVPAEWIAAHGFRPLWLTARCAAQTTAGLCAYAGAYAASVRSFCTAREMAGGGAGPTPGGDACYAMEEGLTVFASTCDQMRRTADIARVPDARAHVFHVPHTWETAAAQRLYRDELRRLGAVMERGGGTTPSAAALRDAMERYDRARARLAEVRSCCPARVAAELRERLYTEGPDLQAAAKETAPRGAPVALVGGPLLAEHRALLDLIEGSGARIVLDATEHGERALPPRFDRRALKDDPFEALADAYFNGIADAFQRPNTRLYTYLRDCFRERGVRGVILVHYRWCDTWRAEAGRMRDWLEVPLLAVDLDSEPALDGRVQTRIESFAEVLR